MINLFKKSKLLLNFDFYSQTSYISRLVLATDFVTKSNIENVLLVNCVLECS